jgi:flagellar protein FliO/FliZ
MDALILGLRVFVALGAVLGLMWLLQRRLGKGTGRRRADRALTIVSRQSVGQKASVVVVDASGQRFLLGVTEHAVNVLHTGDIPEEPAEAPAPAPRRGGAAGAFAQILAGAGVPAAHLDGAVAPHGAVASDGAMAADGDVASGRAATAAVAEPGAPERPLSRRSSIHRESHTRTSPGRGTLSASAAHPPLHGSILAGSTWKQAAAALRSGRRN